MTTFYTRKGDDGTTGILGEGRVAKSDVRMEAIGAVDESTSALGVARSMTAVDQTAEILLKVQRELYWLMSETAADLENAKKFRKIGIEQITWLETQTDAITQMVILPREFIVPGDNRAAAALDMARTIVRRAERRLVELAQRGDIENPFLLSYLNRLSSLCFVLELREIQAGGQDRPTLAKQKA